jgi:hypothetical protein
MPKHGPPSPLGRLVQRRRLELGIKSQQDLSDLTAAQGLRVPANTISRNESGATQTMHPEHLAAVGKALGFESDEDFILASYAPGGRRAKGSPGPERADREEHRPTGPEAVMLDLIRDWPEQEQWRAVRVVRALATPPTSS